MITGRMVALKHIFFQAPQRGQDAAAVSQKRGRELAALKAVSHPNVVQLLEALPLVRCFSSLRCTSVQARDEQGQESTYAIETSGAIEQLLPGNLSHVSQDVICAQGALHFIKGNAPIRLNLPG